MARLLGVDIPNRKKVGYSLCYIYGVGPPRAKEILDASKGLGNSVRKKEETHKMAEANKAFSFFR